MNQVSEIYIPKS